MQVKCNFLRANKLNTNPPKATFYCKLQCSLHLRSCLKTPQKSANQNLELSPPPPAEPPGSNSKRYSSLSVIISPSISISVCRGLVLEDGKRLLHRWQWCFQELCALERPHSQVSGATKTRTWSTCLKYVQIPNIALVPSMGWAMFFFQAGSRTSIPCLK